MISPKFTSVTSKLFLDIVMLLVYTSSNVNGYYRSIKKVSKEKSVEIRMRNTLKRRGYRLKKSGRRDPLALDYNNYWIYDNGNIYFGGEHGVPLDEIVDYVDNRMGRE